MTIPRNQQNQQKQIFEHSVGTCENDNTKKSTKSTKTNIRAFRLQTINKNSCSTPRLILVEIDSRFQSGKSKVERERSWYRKVATKWEESPFTRSSFQMIRQSVSAPRGDSHDIYPHAVTVCILSIRPYLYILEIHTLIVGHPLTFILILFIVIKIIVTEFRFMPTVHGVLL